MPYDNGMPLSDAALHLLRLLKELQVKGFIEDGRTSILSSPSWDQEGDVEGCSNPTITLLGREYLKENTLCV